MKKTKKINKLTIKRRKFSRRKRYIKKRHLKKYKGGVNLEISNIPAVIPILHNYSTIYIAIGAKFIKDNYPISLNTGSLHPGQCARLLTKFTLSRSSCLQLCAPTIFFSQFLQKGVKHDIQTISGSRKPLHVIFKQGLFATCNFFLTISCFSLSNLLILSLNAIFDTKAIPWE